MSSTVRQQMLSAAKKIAAKQLPSEKEKEEIRKLCEDNQDFDPHELKKMVIEQKRTSVDE